MQALYCAESFTRLMAPRIGMLIPETEVAAKSTTERTEASEAFIVQVRRQGSICAVSG